MVPHARHAAPKISRHLIKRERLSPLLSGPPGRLMCSDVEMHDPSAVVSQHQKAITSGRLPRAVPDDS
jgi:hypothetical protein